MLQNLIASANNLDKEQSLIVTANGAELNVQVKRNFWPLYRKYSL